jgi:hypothetical protein
LELVAEVEEEASTAAAEPGQLEMAKAKDGGWEQKMQEENMDGWTRRHEKKLISFSNSTR